MTKVSVIIPVYNVEKYVAEAVESVLAQTFSDYEIIIVDDGSSDASIDICRRYDDPRIRIVSQKNRGLPGARNTGIWHARGEYVALLDADDFWREDKLALHVAHLDGSPAVGVSYSQSAMIDRDGHLLAASQLPKLTGVTAEDVFCRNPVGNGSAPVLRKQVFEDISFIIIQNGRSRVCYFDEDFRYSEDIECWMRIALSTEWRFEGLAHKLTQYRIVAGGLSANTEKMMQFWQRMRTKVRAIEPGFEAMHGPRAYGYQRRYYARRAIAEGRSEDAISHLKAAISAYPSMLVEEPYKTVVTAVAAIGLKLIPGRIVEQLRSLSLHRTARLARGQEAQ